MQTHSPFVQADVVAERAIAAYVSIRQHTSAYVSIRQHTRRGSGCDSETRHHLLDTDLLFRRAPSGRAAPSRNGSALQV
jgi:hypothetical protein